MVEKKILRKFEVYVIDLNCKFTSSEDVMYTLFNSLDIALIHAFLKKEIEIEWDEDSELNKIYPDQKKIDELIKTNEI